MNEYLDESGRLTIELASSCSNDLFQCFANRLSEKIKAVNIEQLDGIDQRYWDYKVSEAIVVLHSDTFMGISIHIKDGSNETLLKKIAAELLSK